MKRIVIAVDGLAGSGKTTLSKLLAQQIGFVHLNTGLIYRAVALLALTTRCDVDSEKKLMSMLAQHRIELRAAEGTGCTVLVDGKDVTSAVQTPEVSEATSKSSRHPLVRASVLSMQREAFLGKNLVAEGRDMGTIVFPDAPLKFFIQAAPDVRVERRLQQLYGDAANADIELRKKEMIIEITERDARDANRTVAPTKPASDAILVDNSLKSLETALAELVSHVRARGLLK